MKKFFIFFLFLTNVQAQSFSYQAELKAVSLTGYYRLVLPPAVVGHLNNRLSDIHLYDSQQHEVPYLLARQAPSQQSTFRPYEVVSRQMTPHPPGTPDLYATG